MTYTFILVVLVCAIGGAIVGYWMASRYSRFDRMAAEQQDRRRLRQIDELRRRLKYADDYDGGGA